MFLVTLISWYMNNMVIPGKMLIDDAAQEFESEDLLNEGVDKCNIVN